MSLVVSRTKTYDIVYALIALNIADRIRDWEKGTYRYLNGAGCIVLGTASSSEEMTRKECRLQGKTKADNLEEISSQLLNIYCPGKR